jgi:hypothetical protein
MFFHERREAACLLVNNPIIQWSATTRFRLGVDKEESTLEAAGFSVSSCRADVSRTIARPISLATSHYVPHDAAKRLDRTSIDSENLGQAADTHPLLFQETICISSSLSVLTSGLEVVETSTSFHRPILVSGYHDQQQQKMRVDGSRRVEASPSTSSSSPPPPSRSTVDGGGLIGLDPSTGQELWRRPFAARPHGHDCHLADLDGDGIRECVVVGDRGLLAAVDPIKGNLSFS